VKIAAFESAFCAVTNSLMISFLRDARWDFDQAGFRSNGGALHYYDHLAQPRHGLAVAQRRTEALRKSLNHRNFWAMKARAFPNLVFGRDVEGQLSRFDATALPLLFRRLAELNKKAATWQSNAGSKFPEGPPEISEETHATMVNYGTRMGAQIFRRSTAAKVGGKLGHRRCSGFKREQPSYRRLNIISHG
jgi:hypothetical protein